MCCVGACVLGADTHVLAGGLGCGRGCEFAWVHACALRGMYVNVHVDVGCARA